MIIRAHNHFRHLVCRQKPVTCLCPHIVPVVPVKCLLFCHRKTIFTHRIQETLHPLSRIPIIFRSTHKTKPLFPMYLNKMPDKSCHSRRIFHKKVDCSLHFFANADHRTMTIFLHIVKDLLPAAFFTHCIQCQYHSCKFLIIWQVPYHLITDKMFIIVPVFSIICKNRHIISLLLCFFDDSLAQAHLKFIFDSFCKYPYGFSFVVKHSRLTSFMYDVITE